MGGILAPLPGKAVTLGHSHLCCCTLGSHTLRGKAHGPRCTQGALCRGTGTGLPLWLWGTRKLFVEELMYGQVINLLAPRLLAWVLGDFC